MDVGRRLSAVAPEPEPTVRGRLGLTPFSFRLTLGTSTG